MSSSLLAARFVADYDTCTKVSPQCPVSATTLGYYPNMGVNAFAVVIFGLCTIVSLAFLIKSRTWGYSLIVAAGCVLECAGYIGRILLHENPWDSSGFKLQIVAIILGPTLLCVGIYLTLKHVCDAFNPGLSRIPPRLYPAVFVPADVSCLVIQAIGGGIAAAAGKTKSSLLQSGNHTIIAGICLQVVVLACFGIVSGEYLFRMKKWLKSGHGNEQAVALWGRGDAKRFIYAIIGAYALILIRCIYRIAEMAGGWGNYIMQDEPSFIVLESFMIMIACVLLTFVPPPASLFFPSPKPTTLSTEDYEITSSSHEMKEPPRQDSPKEEA